MRFSHISEVSTIIRRLQRATRAGKAAVLATVGGAVQKLEGIHYVIRILSGSPAALLKVRSRQRISRRWSAPKII